MIPRINSSHGAETRNIINRVIEVLNQQGKTLQDLVAEGQLTPTQYAELLTTINSLVKSGNVDKSDLTPEFKGEIEGFNTQLAEKVGGGKLASMADLAQDVKEGMTGGSVAVVGEGSVSTVNLANDLKDTLTFRISNKLVNNNFADVTGWAGLFAGIEAVNNSLRVTGTGTSPEFTAWVTTDAEAVVGKRIFIKLKLKTLNSKAIKTDIRLRGSAGGTLSTVHTINHANASNELEIAFSTEYLEAYGTSKIRIYITQHYPLSTDANGAQFEISKMSVIDYTEAGLAAYNMTDKEFTNILNQRFANGHFTGTVDLFNSKNVIKALANLPEPPEPIEPGEVINPATFTDGEGKIVAVKRNIVYRSNSSGTFRSTDGGYNWSPVIGIPEPVTVGIVLLNGVVLLFSDTVLYRAQDGINFTGRTFTELGFRFRPYYTGIWSGDGRYVPQTRVIFGEYVNTKPAAIWTSQDSGLTWVKTLDVTEEIRHFHVIRWNPQTYKWYACSGDTNAEIRWYEGDNSGTNWTPIVEGDAYSNPQIYRILGLTFDEGNNFYWITDSDLSENSSVMKANYSNLLEPELLTTIPSVGYGLVAEGPIMFAVSRPNHLTPSSMTYIYMSEDSGKNWRQVKKDDVSITNDGGYYEIQGPNHKGEFFINHRFIPGKTSGHMRVSY